MPEVICPRCGKTRTLTVDLGLMCQSCRAFRQAAIKRILKLRPIVDRLIGAVACVRKITTVGRVDVTANWKDVPERADIAQLLYLLEQAERELEIEVDEWSLLLLRVEPLEVRGVDPGL